MSNNFDLRKFLTENKLTSVAKTITEATDFSNHYDFEYRKIDGDCYKIDPKTKEKSKVHHSYCKLPNNEETTVSEVDGKVASDKLNLTGVNSEITNAKSFAKALLGLATKLGEREGFNPESNSSIRKAMEFLKAASGDASQEQPVNEYEHHYRKVGGECRKYNDEGDYTVVSMQYCQYNEGEVNESEGYIEVMGDDFDEAVDQIVFAWEQWKNGPATEPEDIEPARQDVVDYIKSLLK